MSVFRTITTAAALAALVVASGARAQAPAAEATDPIEWSAGLALRLPGLGDFDVYKPGVAVEVQYRNWFWSVHGVALSLGIERWKADADSRDWGGSPSGDLTLLSLGVSWVGLLFESDSGLWTVEAGLRYHIASSDLKLRTGAGTSDVEVGNGVTGVLALGYERRLTESTSLTAALSYHPDLLVGEADSGGVKLRDNKLESWGVQLGLRWRL